MREVTDEVRQLVIRGCYAEAFEQFTLTNAPSAELKRWAGVALLNLGKVMEARTLLLSARGQQCHEAGIELATAFRLLGYPDRAQKCLDELPDLSQQPFDRALALRERGAVEFAFGQMPQAYAVLEEAWEAACESSEEQALLPGIALSLGYVCLSLCAEKRSLYFLDFALPLAHAHKRRDLLMIRGACEMYQGQLNVAERTLKLASEVGRECGGQVATLVYFRALCHRYQGQATDALELFVQCAELSRENDESNTECLAELGAMAVCVDLRDLTQANLHLARAEAISGSRKVQGMICLRRAQLLMKSDPGAALEHIIMATEAFSALKLHRELAWAYLYLTEIYLQCSEFAAANEAFTQALLVRAALANAKAVALELRSLPRVTHFIQQHQGHSALWLDWQGLDGASGLELQVTTLGQPLLQIDQRTLRPNASLLKTIELLCYFERNGEATLHKTLAEIFADKPERTARMHFHLMRKELSRLVPGVAIEFQKTSRVYRLCTEGIHLRLDINELLQNLHAGGVEGLKQALACYRGPFLKDSESEWVIEERSKVEWLIIKVGLESLEDYFNQGEDRLCLNLAQQLLEVEPLNEGIHELLIRSTGRLRGAVAARHILQQSQKQFLEEVGEVPPGIVRLKFDLTA